MTPSAASVTTALCGCFFIHMSVCPVSLSSSLYVLCSCKRLCPKLVNLFSQVNTLTVLLFLTKPSLKSYLKLFLLLCYRYCYMFKP